jgi:protein phosphatase/serine/threonine-protein phosphatase Stp1
MSDPFAEIEASSARSGPCLSFGATHQGVVRSANQDRYVNRPDLGLWAVADGAGGHEDGAYAAAALARGLDALPAGLGAGELLACARQTVIAVNAALLAEQARRGTGPIVSTIVILLARGDHYACLWAGDSRVYVLRQAGLTRLTRDHSLVQELVDSGALRAEQAEQHPRANVITRAVGAEEEIALDKISDAMQPGDQFLLCSDGLFKALDESVIAGLLREGADAAALIQAAVAARATDNVTAVVVRIARPAPAAAEEEDPTLA